MLLAQCLRPRAQREGLAMATTTASSIVRLAARSASAPLLMGSHPTVQTNEGPAYGHGNGHSRGYIAATSLRRQRGADEAVMRPCGSFLPRRYGGQPASRSPRAIPGPGPGQEGTAQSAWIKGFVADLLDCTRDPASHCKRRHLARAGTLSASSARQIAGGSTRGTKRPAYPLPFRP